MDDTVHEVKVEMADLDTTIEVKVEDVPEEDPAWVIIKKIDAKTTNYFKVKCSVISPISIWIVTNSGNPIRLKDRMGTCFTD